MHYSVVYCIYMSLRRTKKSRKTDMLSLSLSRGQVLCSKVIPFYCPFLLASASSQCFGIQHLKTIWTYYDVFLSKKPGPIPFFSVSNSRHWCILKQSAETVKSTQPTILLKGTASLPWWNSCWLIWTLVQTRCGLSIQRCLVECVGLRSECLLINLGCYD